MDPEGTIYFLINLIISIITCLYIANEGKEYDGDTKTGINVSIVSAALIFMANFYYLVGFTLPKFSFNSQIMLGALFIFTVIPAYTIGIAINEKTKVIIKILSPFIALLNITFGFIIYFIIDGVFKMAKLSVKSNVTEKDVIALVDETDDEVLDEEQKEMIENIFELNSMKAEDVMTHRTEVFALEADMTCDEVIHKTIEEGYSRIPVYEKRIDTIIGVLYAKDLLVTMYDEEKLAQPIKNLMRKAMFVPESCAANELLLQFKVNRTQIAIVVDEYGGTSGIVTMEDILEEIVGDIEDEYDKEEKQFIVYEDGSAICEASMYIEDVLEIFDIELDDASQDKLDEQEFETIGGLIIHRLEKIPHQEDNAQVEFKDLVFRVLEVADRRIEKVLVYKNFQMMNKEEVLNEA